MELAKRIVNKYWIVIAIVVFCGIMLTGCVELDEALPHYQEFTPN